MLLTNSDTVIQLVSQSSDIASPQPYFQERCRELIDGGCIAAIIKDGELCIRYSEITNYTPYGYDPLYPEYDWPLNSQFNSD